MKKKTVFFNASVILAALRSTKGGSAKIIQWAREGNFYAIISEIVLDEVYRHLLKIDVSPDETENLLKIFKIYPAPPLILVNKYSKTVLDKGDAHLFASCEETNSDYLVSLDKKHVLSLRSLIKKPKIVNPQELLILLPSLF